MTDASLTNIEQKPSVLANVLASPGKMIAYFSREFLKTARTFTVSYVLCIITFLISFPVSAVTKAHPDFSTVSGFAWVLGLLFLLLGVAMIVAKFIHMAVVEKPESPISALGKWCVDQIVREQRVFNLLHMLIVVSLFIAGFSVLKGAIAILHPFSWDELLRDWDKALHFGSYPHEWLSYFVNSPFWVSFFNLFYNLWFFILLLSLIVAGANASRKPVHMRYFVSFLFLWLVAGFFIATGFSSAGPCFFGRAGFGSDYVVLMAQLNEAANTHSVWAIETQNLLWDGFVGARDGTVGISAFPSLHVGTATLLALYAGSKGFLQAVLGWAFALIIMLGSVILAWHYAVDGYAGALLAFATWKIVPALPFMKAGKTAR